MKLTEAEKAALRSECDALRKTMQDAEAVGRKACDELRLKQQALFASECPLEVGQSYNILVYLYVRGRLKNASIFSAEFEEVAQSGKLYFKKAAFVEAFLFNGEWRDAEYPYGPVSKKKHAIINNAPRTKTT